MDEGLRDGEESLFEERTGGEDGQIDELEVGGELFFDQSRAVLARTDQTERTRTTSTDRTSESPSS